MRYIFFNRNHSLIMRSLCWRSISRVRFYSPNFWNHAYRFSVRSRVRFVEGCYHAMTAMDTATVSADQKVAEHPGFCLPVATSGALYILQGTSAWQNTRIIKLTAMSSYRQSLRYPRSVHAGGTSSINLLMIVSRGRAILSAIAAMYSLSSSMNL